MDAPAKRSRNRQIVLRALTDPEFRRLLQAEPARALRLEKLSPKNQAEVRSILAAVQKLEAQISTIADELLCANGGPCGIA